MAEEYHDGDDMFDEVSRPSISFKDREYGFFYEGEVIDAPKKLQSRDFTSGNLAFWDDGTPKMSVVFGIRVTACPDPEEVDQERSIWVAKGSNLYAAVAAGQRAGGGHVRRGGTIRVTFESEKKNEDPKKNPIKQYSVIWTEPNGFVEATPPAAPAAAATAAAIMAKTPPTPPPPAMTAPAASAAAPPEVPVGQLMAQVEALIKTGRKDVQIAAIPSVAAAGITAEAIAGVRNTLGVPA